MLAGDYGPIAPYIHPAPTRDHSGHLEIARTADIVASRASSDENSALSVTWNLTPHMEAAWQVDAAAPDAPRVLRYSKVRIGDWVRNFYLQAVLDGEVVGEVLHPFGTRTYGHDHHELHFGDAWTLQAVCDTGRYAAGESATGAIVRNQCHLLLPVNTVFTAADKASVRAGFCT